MERVHTCRKARASLTNGSIKLHFKKSLHFEGLLDLTRLPVSLAAIRLSDYMFFEQIYTGLPKNLQYLDVSEKKINAPPPPKRKHILYPADLFLEERFDSR
ncbi:hypothetical protein XU18_2537 [Perkinsela sp. CCAP 1560/4]|nr:hypothetical protein XU18_2537 [Perkinsela sp. CCAP 1560/4]|eukprot:KNH06636.1 hypothetical protein XU18_2537 [Perkinsela sp. CCAP 1560/4]